MTLTEKNVQARWLLAGMSAELGAGFIAIIIIIKAVEVIKIWKPDSPNTAAVDILEIIPAGPVLKGRFGHSHSPWAAPSPVVTAPPCPMSVIPEPSEGDCPICILPMSGCTVCLFVCFLWQYCSLNSGTLPLEPCPQLFLF
jgi:hypothetical protein